VALVARLPELWQGLMAQMPLALVAVRVAAVAPLMQLLLVLAVRGALLAAEGAVAAQLITAAQQAQAAKALAERFGSLNS
jgi:hypothetical protein